MAEEYRAGQGSITPTMLVGLGGTGSRIVDRLARRAATLPNWESQLRPLTSFVSIDTNTLDQHRLSMVPHGCRLNIAAVDKSLIMENYRRAQDVQALQWLDRGYQPRGGTNPGAGQIRLESRLGFFFHSPEIRQRLRALVQEALRPGIVWRQALPRKFNVYVFATLAGGTGSGSFLSAAYLIDAVIREQGWQPRIIANLLLSTLLLDDVGPELHADIHANAYAALKELEHLTKLDYPQVKREGRTAEPFVYCRDDSGKVLEVQSRPFFLTFLFDQPAHGSLPDATQAIADAAFLQVFTPVIDNLASEYDNYEKTMMELTRFPGELRHVGQGYSKNFGVFGSVAMVLPGRDLLEYCALRFAAQAMRSQITFGVDPRDPDDERARALARLAVNYSDPEFLNLADAEREKEIHRAFVASVQEMARQDAVEEMTRGFWYQLVETIDDGPVTGVDAEGKPVRGESLLAVVERRLNEARAPLLNKVSIKERAFAFHLEGVSQYHELVSRLREDIRQARVIVEEGSQGLVTSAQEGEAIAALKLDPIAERYLALRKLDHLEREVIPTAERELAAAQSLDIDNANVQKRLEELHQNLQDAVRLPRFKREKAFLEARNEAEEYYRKVAKAARRIFDNDVRLRQLRALADYLRRRSRQYARLASRMNALVQDLEGDAERLRRGEVHEVLPLALRVEVFETLDEPRRRIWERVHAALFLDDGRHLATFDRQLLAQTIARELKPLVGADGRVREKSVDETVADLRRALCALGRDRLCPAILGDADQPGLDLPSGLELEARLMLAADTRPGEAVGEKEIVAYREKKLRALAQLAGVLGRVNTAEAAALGDGVLPNRTRQLVVGLVDQSGELVRGPFVQALENALAEGGHQVKTDKWHDPRLAIVHDVVLPIPLYYFAPVVDEIENGYLKKAADERRGYHLHTDFNWEKSLPNLNPRRSELAVDWSLRMLADGLVGRVVSFQEGRWVWYPEGETKPDALGPTLSSALYRLGEMHRFPDVQRAFERAVREALGLLPAEDVEFRRAELVRRIEKLASQMSRREMNGEMTREDVLDRPILHTLLRYVPGGRHPDTAEANAGVSYGELTGDAV